MTADSQLTPMVVQYLVGLCCLRHDPDAVDVIVGDLVLDTAAGKPRDVDVTVTLKEEDGSVSAFKAYEVKRERSPLDVAIVEQLCAKLLDMPSVTHRAIVSASGYTDAAVAKARARGVSLLVLREMDERIAETGKKGKPIAPNVNLHMALLNWVGWRTQIYAPRANGPFHQPPTGAVFTRKGKLHKAYPTWRAYERVLLRRSAEVLWQLAPGQTSMGEFASEPLGETEYEVGPAWPHTHTLDVSKDQVYLKVHDRIVLTVGVSISGSLRWERRPRPFEYYVIEHIDTKEIFAGAAIADWGTSDGRMFAVVFTSSSNALNFYKNIELPEKHRNAIRQLRIPRIKAST